MGVKVREKPKGSGVWWIFINYRGRRRSKKVGDEATALEVARKVEAKLVLGEFGFEKEDKPQVPTFKEYAELWLALPHDSKESTRKTYGKNLHGHVFPTLGKRRLDEISRKDLKALFDKLLVKGKAPATVGLARAVISGIFNHALDSELIDSTPLQGMKLRKGRKASDVECLTEEQADLLLEQARMYKRGIYYAPLLCALRTGMRLGELLAIQWGDIDFNDRFIDVRRSYRDGRLTGTKNKLTRRVDMSPMLAKALESRARAQKKQAFKDGTEQPVWVFPSRKGGILCRGILRRAFKACLKRAGLRSVRFHDLRHTYATVRLTRGHNVGDVSAQLGHSSIKITYDIYCHWIPGKFKNEVDELDRPRSTAPYAHPVEAAVNDFNNLN
jgi:integrase